MFEKLVAISKFYFRFSPVNTIPHSPTTEVKYYFFKTTSFKILNVKAKVRAARDHEGQEVE